MELDGADGNTESMMEEDKNRKSRIITEASLIPYCWQKEESYNSPHIDEKNIVKLGDFIGYVVKKEQNGQTYGPLFGCYILWCCLFQVTPSQHSGRSCTAGGLLLCL